MRRLLLVLALLLAAAAPSPAGTGFQQLTSSAVAAPCDAVSGCSAAYGFRKLRAAYAGKDVNLRRASDNTTQDCGFVGGDFDAGCFNTFCAATTCFAAKVYDQSGGGNDAVQATLASQPQVLLSLPTARVPGLRSFGLAGFLQPGGVPALKFSGTQSLTATLTQAQPLSLSTVAEATGTSGVFGMFASSSFEEVYWAANGNGVSSPEFYAGGASNPTDLTAPDNIFHALIGVTNGSSSFMVVDGAVTSISGNAAGSGLGPALWIGSDGFSTPVTGNVSEVLLFSGALSAAQAATLAGNQKAYSRTP